MKILQVIPVFYAASGGPVSVVRSISKELSKRHDVTIYTTSAVDQKRDFKGSPFEVLSNGYRTVYFPRILRRTGFNISLSMMETVKATLKEFDVVHLHSWRQFQDILINHYAIKYKIPYVQQVHGSIPRIIAKQKLKWLFDVFFGYKELEGASKAIALSKREADQYKSMNVPCQKIIIVPNGIDLSEYNDLPAKGFFKEKFGIPRKKIILYLGRIHKTKGIDLLVQAFAYLKKGNEYRDTVLVIAGPDEGYASEIKSLARSSSISDSVLFTGFISAEDKIKALVDADVFVTPSFYGFPVTFLEACATGTPIVTTTLGDELEWINGNVGYVTAPTYYDLAKAIGVIVSNDEVHHYLSRNCIETIKSRFSIEKIVDSLEKIYNEVI